MLHTVNKSPFQDSALESCVQYIREGDVLLLIEDGVYAAQAGSAKAPIIENVMKTNKVYAIGADLKARALTKLVDGVQVTDYAGFVELVETHKTHAWL